MTEVSTAAAVSPKAVEGEPTAPLKSGLPRGALAWILQQGARDPYVILITIYIFSPYFSRVLVGDPVKGQALIANISTTYGLLTALTAPLLGAMIEQYGPRKPMLGIVLGVMVPLLVGLWWAMPAGGLPLMATSLILVALGLVYNWGDVLSNSLLSRAAGPTPGRAALISGLGYALASGLSVAVLLFMLWGLVLPGQVDWPGVPGAPLFGLDASQNEPSRSSGPLAAAVMTLGAIPFFLWTPDAARTGRSWRASLGAGIAMLRDTFANLQGHRDVATFLAARMLYCDGMTALLLFGGLFASGLMGWGALEMMTYGISLSIFAVIGGLVAPWLDRTLGPRKAVQIEIAGALLTMIATLGMGRDKIVYFWSYDPAAHAPIWNGPLFRTAPELVYLGLGLLIAVFVTAQYASSRTLLIRLAPPEKTAAFFGLYALSGTATAWLGSLLVALATAIFNSQVAGFLPIAGLLLLGFCGLFLVRGGERER